jgi:hypothetical protein
MSARIAAFAADHASTGMVWVHVDDHAGVLVCAQKLTPAEARKAATKLLRAAEDAEAATLARIAAGEPTR